MCAAPAASLRSSLSYVCTAVSELGISGLTPEVLWQAKLDQIVSLQLLKALHSLLILDLADFPEKRGIVLSQYWDHIACEHLCTTLPDTGLHFVFSQLVKRGYPRAGMLVAFTKFNGREVLLALGWLLAQTRALQHALNKHLLQYKITALLPPYPQDGFHAEAAERSALHHTYLARQHVQQVLQVCADQQGWPQVEVASHHALMLHTKCKAKSRSLQALQHSRCALMHNLVQLQSSEQHLQHMQSSRRNTSISSYEWSLLQSSEKLRHHEESVVAAACIAADCRQAQYHVTAFFEWLATLHDGQQPATNPAHQAPPEAWLHSSFSLAALPQLQCIAPSLQTKLHAAMQSVTDPLKAASSHTKAGPLLCQIQHEIACLAPDHAVPVLETDTFVDALPSDIQHKVEMVRETHGAAHMPWHGFQLDAATMVHIKHVERDDGVNTNDTHKAKTEVDRLTQAMLQTAKALARTRAGNKRQLSEAAMPLSSSHHLVVNL